MHVMKLYLKVEQVHRSLTIHPNVVSLRTTSSEEEIWHSITFECYHSGVLLA